MDFFFLEWFCCGGEANSDSLKTPVLSGRVVCQVDDKALLGWRCPLASVYRTDSVRSGIKKSNFWTVTVRLPLPLATIDVAESFSLPFAQPPARRLPAKFHPAHL